MRMHTMALAVSCHCAAVGLLVAAGDATEDAVKKDLAALKGVWAVVSAEKDGKKLGSDQFKDVTVTYDGAGKILAERDGKVLFAATFKIDPTKKPKTIDATQTSDGDTKGKVLLGIYELKDDTLTFCSQSDSSKDRPTDFTAKPGSGHFLRVYKRVKS
jgi:uncharacterized protein (TIGR03067 family)